jgi:hypothetical protein
VFLGTSYVLGILETHRDEVGGFRDYVPEHCNKILQDRGAKFETEAGEPRVITLVPEDRRKMLDTFLRIFTRNSGATEEVMHVKLGKRYSKFEDEILPLLTEYDVIRPTEYRGSGHQRRFELNFPLEQILKAEDPDALVPQNLKGFWAKMRG